MFTIISQSPIFKGLSLKEAEDVLKSVAYSTRTYKKGHMIVQSGERCTNLLIVIRGSVKGEMVDYSGKTIKIEDIAAPRPLAAAFLFGVNNVFPVNIITNEETDILYIPKSSFVSLLQSNTIILNNYLNTISSRTQFLSERISFLAFKTIKGKIAHYILCLANNEQKTVTLPKSQQELSDFFGVARPSFARSLGELEQEGVIKINRREISILNITALKSLLRCG